MAAELSSVKLNAEEHLLLDQPLLRLPIEVDRTNLKSAQIAVDVAKKAVVHGVNSAASAAQRAASSGASGEASSSVMARDALVAIDGVIAKAKVLKRKLSAISTSTDSANVGLGARLEHMYEVRRIPSLADVKYDEWSRTRLDRLLVDYLLRMGYMDSAKGLAEAKGLQNLVQVEIEAFESGGKIAKCLREGQSTKEALSWCDENKKELAKIDSDLIFEIRLQQYIELIRKGPEHRVEALAHAKKHLRSNTDVRTVRHAAGLMVFPSDVAPFKEYFSNERWHKLADLFVRTHHQMYNIPSVPQLNTALSAGLSALKTPACHSKNNPNSSISTSTTDPMPIPQGHASSHRDTLKASRHSSSNGSSHAHAHSQPAPLTPGTARSSWALPICPICSTELNALARNVPYAHHSKSNVDHDPVVLPNGRIYGRDKLMRSNEKLGTEKGRVRDPLDGSEYDESKVQKVYIS